MGFFDSNKSHESFYQLSVMKVDLPAVDDVVPPQTKSPTFLDKLPNTGGTPESTGAIVLNQFLDSITGISITKELTGKCEMSLSFELGGADLAGSETSPSNFQSAIYNLFRPENLGKSRLVLTAGYRNLAPADRDIGVVLVDSKLQPTTIGAGPDDKPLTADADSISGADSAAQIPGGDSLVLTDRTRGEPLSSPAKILPSAISFVGVLQKPSISGGQNGIINFQATSVSSFWAQNILGSNTGTGANPIQTSTPVTASQSAQNTLVKPLIDGLFKRGLAQEEDSFGGIESLWKYVSINTKYLEGYRVPLTAADMSLAYTPTIETRGDFMKRVCRKYLVTYTILPLDNGQEIICFLPDKPTEMQRIFASNPSLKKLLTNIELSPKLDASFIALRMSYGIEVVSFSFTPNNLGITAPAQTAQGGLVLGVDTVGDGTIVQYQVDRAKIRELTQKFRESGSAGTDFARYADQAGVPNSTDASALVKILKKWVEEDPRGFIVAFTVIAKEPGSLAAVSPAPPQIGSNGISLNLDLKYAIPGLNPGMFVYFTAAIKEIIPSYIRQVYRINKITEKYDPKSDVYTQKLECKR